ncbi:UDP-2,3-diacylglucosamine hydrolase protein [Ketogulonicigenium robustum]|uniref:UDP-2,3-diacylglucosamine hydrolase protein n=1 Tax=Ketogulonicigenium robustum TaxID=92947 RepID=A0A1W6NZR8_9RHOB|nr:UDP-2,3-diacylglucosamine diphosphatase [Ketogulonicigenium robustum]ARO14689.1 UDP-2,3-diacylglucosamine hydrolase protein [Ketogulonicigenium robustum]
MRSSTPVSSQNTGAGQTPKRVRTLFLSDMHLGSRGAQAKMILEFLDAYDAPTIYLVGDIVDGWRLKKSWYWPQTHNEVVRALLRKADSGTRIIYLPGNHDEFLRDYPGVHFGGIEIIDRVIHVSATGKRYLVIHGDQFDAVITKAKWLAHVGDWAYTWAMGLNSIINFVRRRMGLSYWSLSAVAKSKVKKAVNFIGHFEDTLSVEAQRSGTDGVICGHIHAAANHMMGDVHYLNTGDWVDGCTALVEHDDGEFEVIYWNRPNTLQLTDNRVA